MKSIAIIFNVVLFGFTCLVLLTDGLPTGAAYITFNLWVLLTMILNVVVISRFSASTIMKIAAIVCNIVFLGFVCWAFADQYPHPAEAGFIPFAVLMVLTPILSMVALFRSGVGDGCLCPFIKRKAVEK